MASEQRARRRRYSKEMKAQVLAECGAPGASVAKVAMSTGSLAVARSGRL